ncbi:gluconolactonase [Planctomycetales bacterium ZRK34]|nr:gluconolactonase [Planctomycetales bacterium ZRK34]
MPKILCASLIALLCLSVAAWAEDAPKGTLTKYTFDQSRIFPGTVRDYWVYIPAQYDGSKPACVHVNQDGVQFDAPVVFDQLIAQGKMPVTIGVFVRPGVVPAPTDNAQPRFNRSYEYDSTNDNYVRFLLDELLPHIEKTLGLKLSHDGNDRSIGGTSSGAICAFNAAWRRPDAFSRVFSGVGTFIGLRGADEFPIWIRKTEPKPIRVFLQDGTGDLNIYCGDWWMANQTMQRALEFAGYEVNHAWDEGGHNQKGAKAVFPEAMTWLWKDWPQPVQAGLGSPKMQQLLIPGEDWQLVAEGFKSTEGPAVNAKGEVFFNDGPNNKTYHEQPDGKVVEFLNDTQRGDGQAFGPDGRLYSVAAGAEKIIAYSPDGKAEVIAGGFRGNDLVVGHDGSIYVTEPGWDGRTRSKIWYITPGGEKKIVDRGLKFSNGITMSPDQTQLYVADSRSHYVYSYQISGPGKLRYKQKYFYLHVPDEADDSGADGMCVDRDGRLYVATRMGIQVCDQPGRVNCIIPTPNGRVSNLCFGGPNFDTLYATCRDKVYKRKLKVRGAQEFDTPVDPGKPRL